MWNLPMHVTQVLHTLTHIRQWCKRDFILKTATKTLISSTRLSLFGVESIIYTVNHKKGGRTFVMLTLKNLDGFL